ncbi:MAG: hypothetical protein R3F59_33660 [Myxococcota bacterium]
MLIAWGAAAFAQALTEPEPEPAPAEAAPGVVSDERVHELVEGLYGRELPAAGVCVDRPALGEPFTGMPVPVGVQRGARGCVLVGVVVDGALLAPEDALAAALPEAAWQALSSDQRVSALQRWTGAVELAFVQPAGPATVTGRGNGQWVVTQRVLRRGEGAGTSEAASLTTTWGADRRRISVTEDVTGRWLTTLYVRRDKLSGIAEAAVDRALTDHGRVVRQCFSDAWAADLALDGRVRLSWTVADGKVGTVAVITEAGTNEALARCYAQAVRAGSYPAGSSGQVTWVFGVDRRAMSAD